MDKIIVRKKQINHELTVLDIPESRVGAKLVAMYRKDTTPVKALKNDELQRLAKEYYRKQGTGRPTKKDRRTIDDFLDDTE
jgi:ribosome-associated heat shock protein Hsp15